MSFSEYVPAIKKSVVSGTAFFLTVAILSTGYAAYGSLSGATAGAPLTVSAWNAVVDSIIDLNNRWARSGSNIAFTGGNVGIGTTSPADTLHVNGNFRAGGIVTDIPQIELSDSNWHYFWTQVTGWTPTKVELAVGHNSYGVFIDLFSNPYSWNITEGTVQDVRVWSASDYDISIKRVRKPGILLSSAGWDWYVKKTQTPQTIVLVHKITGPWDWNNANTATPN